VSSKRKIHLMFLQAAGPISDHSSLNVAHHFPAYEAVSKRSNAFDPGRRSGDGGRFGWDGE
jgi:hypothetical protein